MESASIKPTEGGGTAAEGEKTEAQKTDTRTEEAKIGDREDVQEATAEERQNKAVENVTLKSENELTRRLHVGNLTRNVTEDHLKSIFTVWGPLKSVEIAMDKIVNLPKGYAHIEFEKRDDAENALDHMNGGQIDGNVVEVMFTHAVPKREISPIPIPPKRPESLGTHRSRGDGERRRMSPLRPRRRSPIGRYSRSPPRKYSRSPPRRYSRSPPRRSPYRPRRSRSPPRRPYLPRRHSPGRRPRSPRRPARRPRSSGRHNEPNPPSNRRTPPRGGQSPKRSVSSSTISSSSSSLSKSNSRMSTTASSSTSPTK